MVTVLCERLSTLYDAGAGVERLLRAAADLRRPPPAEQSADAFWWRIIGEEARHRSTTPKAPRDERAGDPALAGSGAATPSL